MTTTTLFQVTAAGEAQITEILLNHWKPAVRDGVDSGTLSAVVDKVIKSLNLGMGPYFDLVALDTVSGVTERFVLSEESYKKS